MNDGRSHIVVTISRGVTVMVFLEHRRMGILGAAVVVAVTVKTVIVAVMIVIAMIVIVAVMTVIVMIMIVAVMTVIVAVMMTAAAQEPRAGHIDGEANAGNRNRLGEMDRYGCENAGDGLIADQERDHGEYDGAGEPGEIPKLAGAKCEVGIFRMSASVGIGESREEKGTGVGAHMQPIRYQRNRSEQQSAYNLRAHHRAAEPNHSPSLALALLVPFAQEAMRVDGWLGRLGGDAHFITLLPRSF
jgi:hypothetical protein